jgi:hypothetical protein
MDKKNYKYGGINVTANSSFRNVPKIMYLELEYQIKIRSMII